MKNKEALLKEFTTKYYASSFLYYFVFAYVVYNVIFKANGLSILQISLLISFWVFSGLVFEIPSGALADYWSRKKLLVLAPLISALCFLIWFYAKGNFYIYGLGFLLLGISGSFVSGTTEALVYDKLTFLGKIDQYEKVIGRKRSLVFISMGLSSLIGGFLATINPDLAFLVSIIPLFLSALFAALVVEAPKIESTHEIDYFQHISDALKETKSNEVLRYLILFSLITSVFGNLVEYNQLYYESIALPLFLFGVIELITRLLGAYGSDQAHKMKANQTYMLFSLLINSLLLFFIGFTPGYFSLGLLVLMYFINSPIGILLNGRIQRSTDSSSRATVISVKALLVNLVSIFMISGFGLISEKFGLHAIYISASIFLFFSFIWASMNKQKFIIK